jgi:hypothetical protein
MGRSTLNYFELHVLPLQVIQQQDYAADDSPFLAFLLTIVQNAGPALEDVVFAEPPP